MKEVVAWECDDGRRFFVLDSALKWEREVLECSAVVREVPLETPKFLDPNGGNYFQHPVGARSRLEDACRTQSPFRHPREASEGDSPWSDLWFRLACMDEKDREWGQPYFANHPNPDAFLVR